MYKPVKRVMNHVSRFRVEYAVIGASTATAVVVAMHYTPYMALGGAALKFISDEGLAEKFVDSISPK